MCVPPLSYLIAGIYLPLLLPWNSRLPDLTQTNLVNIYLFHTDSGYEILCISNETNSFGRAGSIAQPSYVLPICCSQVCPPAPLVATCHGSYSLACHLQNTFCRAIGHHPVLSNKPLQTSARRCPLGLALSCLFTGMVRHACFPARCSVKPYCPTPHPLGETTTDVDLLSSAGTRPLLLLHQCGAIRTSLDRIVTSVWRALPDSGCPRWFGLLLLCS
jgi:hypothetical protein